MNPGRQRLDKWLWFARVVKTRTLAARLVADGHVRINSVRQDTAAKAVAVGDVLTIALERQVRVLKVLDPGERRGPYEEARLLYEDLTPPAESITPEQSAGPVFDAGAGRPTKKDRRDIDRFRGG
jgi:ribosome-associated heat shock protein Hsp15